MIRSRLAVRRPSPVLGNAAAFLSHQPKPPRHASLARLCRCDATTPNILTPRAIWPTCLAATVSHQPEPTTHAPRHASAPVTDLPRIGLSPAGSASRKGSATVLNTPSSPGMSNKAEELRRRVGGATRADALAASAPSPAAPPGTPRLRAPWFALRFDDEQVERRYAQQQFRAAYPVTLAALLMLGVGCNTTLAVLYRENEAVLGASLVRAARATLALAVRVWLSSMDDQYRALTLFSRFISGAVIVVWIVVLLSPPQAGIDPASAAVACYEAVKGVLAQVYLQYTGVPAANRRLCQLANLVGVTLRPAVSELGRPAEPLILISAVFMGELLVLSLEHFLRGQASERWQALDAHARAEQAQEQAKVAREEQRTAEAQATQVRREQRLEQVP